MAHKEETFVQELSKILEKQGAIKASEAENLARLFEGRTQDQFDYFLLEEGLVTEEQLLDALSEYYKVSRFDALGYFFNHELLHLFPKGFLLRNVVIPIEIDQDVLIVATNRPGPELREQLNEFVDFAIAFKVGTRRDIEGAIKEFYDRAPTEIHPDGYSEDEEEVLHEIEDLDESI